MPRRTTVHDWPASKPDFSAGERGGCPTAKSAPWPKRGETGPREYNLSMKMEFRTHEEAVAYAKCFDSHVSITVKHRENRYGEMVQFFVVDPTPKKERKPKKQTTKTRFLTFEELFGLKGDNK
jgi:hypothetical protein